MKALLIICIFIISCKPVQPPTDGASPITDIKLINSPDVVFAKKMNGTILEISASTPLISASLKNKSDSLKVLYTLVTKQFKSDTVKKLNALVTVLNNDIKLLKIAVAKKDTFFVKDGQQVAGVIGSKLKPLDMSIINNRLQSIEKRIAEILAKLPK